MRPQILTALIFTVLGAVSASPLAPRNGCQPNFEGAGVSVVNPSSGLEWAIISEPTELQGALLVSRAVTKAAEFRFEHTGAPSNPYLIKTLQDPSNNLVVQLLNDGSARLHLASQGAADEIFNVSCDVCPEGASYKQGWVAQGCTISTEDGSKCVQVFGVPDPSGQAQLKVMPCDRSPNQRWEFRNSI